MFALHNVRGALRTALRGLVICSLLDGVPVQAQNLDSLREVWLARQQPDSARFAAAYDLAWDGYMFSAPDSAIALAMDMQQQARAAGSVKFDAMAYDVQAVAWYVKGDLRKALSLFSTSLPMHERIGAHESVADVTTNMASMYSFLGAHDTALMLYDKGLATHISIKDSMAIANDLQAIGRVHMVRGDHARAVDLYHRSLRIHEAIKNDRGLATVHMCLGSMYINMDEYANGLEHYRTSLRLAQGLKDEHQVAKAHLEIGTCQQALGDTVAAGISFRSALTGARALDDRLTTAVAMNKIADVDRAQGRWSMAMAGYREAEAIAHDIEHPAGEVNALIGRASILVSMDRPVEALPLAERAGRLARDAEDLYLNRDAAQLLYRVHKMLGRSGEALSAHEQVRSLDDSLFREENQREVLRYKLAAAYEQQAFADSLRHQTERNQAALAHAENLARERGRRNLLLAGIAMIAVVGTAIWARMRQVARANRAIIAAQERLMASERQREAEQVRTRIATDIHDDLGSGLTKLGLLGRELERAEGSNTKDLATRIVDLSGSTAEALSHIVWATDPEQDSVRSTLARVEAHARHMLANTGILHDLDIEHHGEDRALDPAARHHLILVFKEALNNVVKHARAKRVDIRLHTDQQGFDLLVLDDGTGYDPGSVTTGHGSRSMRTRAEKLGARLVVESSPGHGTRIALSGNWPELAAASRSAHTPMG